MRALDDRGAVDEESRRLRLRAIKVVHTAAWVVFAGAIVAIPPAILLDARQLAQRLIILVSVECLVLAFNGMRCPLTDIAARYTDERSDNFDIYLPRWLARNNKTIFGSLFVVGLILAAAKWAV